MADNTSDKPKMEDYGGEEGGSAATGGSRSGDPGIQGGETGQFGEVGNSGVGTDLTARMEGDPRTGMIKGGEEGHEDAAGPGQYGGETGGLTEGSSANRTEGMQSGGGGSGQGGGSGSTHGHFGGDGPNVTEKPQG